MLEDEPLEATIEIRRGPLALPGAEVCDPLAGEPLSVRDALSWRRGGRTVSVQVVARFPRRGHRSMPPPELVVRDALGLACAVQPASTPAQDVLVLPRTEPVRWGEDRRRSNARLAGIVAPSDALAAVEIDGLRPYRPGTPASRIHWPALARGAGLLERRLLPDGDAQPLVVLDARGAGPQEHLDAAVRAAASLTLELARRGGCLLLFPGERRPVAIDPDLAGWPAAHTRLALIDGGPRTAAPVLRAGARLGAVLYVSAHHPERVPPGLSGTRAGCVLVVPAALASHFSTRPSFAVSGCLGFAVRARAGAAMEGAAA